jgi:hypothetical protein
LPRYWATVDLESPNLAKELDEWHHFYNWHRPHSSLGDDPFERGCDLLWHTPSREDVVDAFVPARNPSGTGVCSWIRASTIDKVWGMLTALTPTPRTLVRCTCMASTTVSYATETGFGRS